MKPSTAKRTTVNNWRIAASPVLTRSLPNSYWDKLGLRQLFPTWERFRSA